ncbi:adenine-specific DNA-methyltransferase [Fibrobacter sp. UWB1]|uniref:adenine-specific DNA-methyltransferase n=1 Tax=Fibrobacter sp. UWB1 TaxID=1964355 RepID=UPI000B52903B|nr:adenine-specific DNA-methyltransferase [Fibrobacter sp. UWB1]OWV26621.1 adenine-specific DNA-methyltransferase [Fibrobacter sp. UWB1]
MKQESLEYFKKGSSQIIHGDAIEALNKIEDESIDLIFVDPPYNIGKNFAGCPDKWKKDEDYLSWCYSWIDLCIKKLKPSGSMYIMTSTQFMPYFDLHIRKQMTILSRIVWSYDSSGVQAKSFYGSMYEPILFCVKDEKNYTFNADDIMVEAKTGSKRKLIDYRKNPPQPYNTMKVPGNVWDFPRVRYRMEEYENHPTQKPIALLDRIIKASSKKGDVVLDPFSGSFTTCFVADSLERKFIGVELQEEYIKIGLRRLGISNEYKGENLQPLQKTFKHKEKDDNLKQEKKSNRKKKDETSLDLFGGK